MKALMDHFSSGQQILSIGLTTVSINYLFFISYRPLRVRSGCLYRISLLKALIKRKNFEIFQSAIFYVKSCATIDRESLIQGSFRFPRMKGEKRGGLLPSEEINGSLASILKSVVPISSSG